ncbi:MAG: hypothetical protein ACPGQL_05480 [Thermoplasmatota archaeon]
MAIGFLDLVLAAGILAMCLGIGWLVHRAGQETQRAKAAAEAAAGLADPVHELRELTAETRALAAEAAHHLEKAADAVRSGVR